MVPTSENRWSKIAVILLSFVFVTTQSVHSQSCVASGPNSPGSAVSASFPGSDFAFNNPTYCFISDGNRATAASIALLVSGQTEYLQATDFGFSIPTTASVCGIQVDVQKSASNVLGLASITDNSVRIIKNGVVTGSDLADHLTHWPTSDTYTSYGDNSTLWLTSGSWLPADINATNFGVAFSGDIHGLVGVLPVVNVNNIRITVYYLDPAILPVRLSQFTVLNNSNTAVLNWQMNDENESTLIIERSANASAWEPLNGLPQKNSLNQQYSYTDLKPLPGRSFYRIKMVNAAGGIKYSESKGFVSTTDAPVKCYPNPFTSYIQLAGVRPGEAIRLTDIYGQQVSQSSPTANSNPWRIDVSNLHPGVYFITVGNTKLKIQKR